MTTQKLTFYPFKNEYFEMVIQWLKKLHVREYYYGEGLDNTISNLELYKNGIRDNGRYFFDFWVACIQEKPFGLLMTSPISGPYDPEDPYDKWFQDGKEIITLDLLIGEENYLGKGLGQRMIREFLLEKCSQVSTVLIDPEIKNTRAIHVYEKVGFKKVEQFFPSHNPAPHWMMYLEI